MMNLKESYQYQNFLKELFTQAYMGLRELNVVKTVRTHYRSRVAEGAIDETVDETTVRPFGDIPVDAVIAFTDAIIEERKLLAEAISDTKSRIKMSYPGYTGIDLDAELSANKLRYQMITRLESLAAIKPEMVRKSTSKDFKFNAEGNQTAYTYPVEEVVSIDFNRDSLREYLKHLKTVAAERSMAAEKAMLINTVNFEPHFDQNDSYMDILTAYAVEHKFLKSENTCE